MISTLVSFVERRIVRATRCVGGNLVSVATWYAAHILKPKSLLASGVIVEPSLVTAGVDKLHVEASSCVLDDDCYVTLSLIHI